MRIVGNAISRDPEVKEFHKSIVIRGNRNDSYGVQKKIIYKSFLASLGEALPYPLGRF